MSPLVTSTRRARPRSRDPEGSRAAILLAARDEFVEHGFSGARTSEIAKGAGVPQGLLYHYFENKEGLWGAVMKDALEPHFVATVDLFRDPPAGDGGPKLLETAVRKYFSFLRENPHVPRLMAWWVADQGWIKRSPVGGESLSADPTEFGAARIRDLQDAGVVRKDLDPGHVIRASLHLCMYWHMNLGGVAAEESVDPDDSEAMNRLQDAHLTHIVEILLRGVLQ